MSTISIDIVDFRVDFEFFGIKITLPQAFDGPASSLGNEFPMKGFLAAGDILINPALLAYASVETDSDGLQLRLGFTGQAGAPQCEIRLEGLEARSVLRWLRTNSEFLDAGSTALRRETRMSAGCPSRYQPNSLLRARDYGQATGTMS